MQTLVSMQNKGDSCHSDLENSSHVHIKAEGDEPDKSMYVMGNINKKLIITPDFDAGY